MSEEIVGTLETMGSQEVAKSLRKMSFTQEGYQINGTRRKYSNELKEKEKN